MIRQPIVAVLGHVDSGKTSLLDRIRGTGVQARESGGITQHIGASFLPVDTIRSTCGKLYKKLESGNTVSGILVIDTPGHEVFTNLRTRGGSAADIAILVMDVNRGIQPQTRESLDILRNRKVPFLVALNKCDQISGWRPAETDYVMDALKLQDKSVQDMLDQKLYDVVGALSVMGYKSEAFYRVQDFRQEIAMVPVSARLGLGIPEMMTVLVGLTQQYLTKKLDQTKKESHGIILEVKEETGLGQTANVILVDGSISMDDTVVVATRDSVISAKPKAILLPRPLDEMRDPRDKFKPAGAVSAAAGVKIASPALDGVLPGSTMYVCSDASMVPEYERRVQEEMQNVLVDTETAGVTIKCDTIGSLEAVTAMLSRAGTPVAKADVGPVTRRDVIHARAVKEGDRHLGVVLAFNVRLLPDAKEEAEVSHVQVFEDKIIYSLIENYGNWVADDIAHEEDAVFAEITPIAKFTFLKGFIFRNNDPAVFGIRVDAGVLKQKSRFMNNTGKKIGIVHQLQDGKKPLGEARAGQEIACSVNGVTVGRQIHEEDEFYTLPHPHEAKQLLGRFAHRLTPDQAKLLDFIIAKQRESDPSYGY